jgi:hypothetical protein
MASKLRNRPHRPHRPNLHNNQRGDALARAQIAGQKEGLTGDQEIRDQVTVLNFFDG